MTREDSGDCAVALHGVTKQFGSTIAVDHLSLEIPRGTAFGLIGPNGAGKTTIIKMLMGLLPPDAGRSSVLGIDPLADPVAVKLRVGYVPEEQCIYRWMRVGEAVGFCSSFYDTWNAQRCAELLDQFELDANKKVKHLSKGMRAKLSLLLAIAHEPEVLILDEPMGGLDPIARDEFLDGVLRALCDRQHTILFCSHMLSDVQRLADTIGIICEGQLLVHDSTDSLLEGTKRIRAVLGSSGRSVEPPAGTIWQRVHDREWLITVRDYSPEILDRLRRSRAVEQVEVFSVGLEDIFKDYVRGRRAGA